MIRATGQLRVDFQRGVAVLSGRAPLAIADEEFEIPLPVFESLYLTVRQQFLAAQGVQTHVDSARATSPGAAHSPVPSSGRTLRVEGS